jgi:N-acetylglucosamine kinase-like BadF-type ATPase
LAKETSIKDKYIIGIDSGATSSEVLIYPSTRAKAVPPLLKEGLRGVHKKYAPINFNVLGFDKTARRLISIIKDSSKKIGLKNTAYIVAGISGARDEKDRIKLAKKITAALRFKNISIYPDTAIAFAAIFSHFDKNCGILLAGTGSVFYFANSSGMIERYGGWGRYIGDEGSGYWIAKEALNRLTLSFDKRGRKTRLEQVFYKKFGINKDNLINHIYHNNFDIAKLTKHVFDCAEAGDEVSIEIIKEAAGKLADHFLPLKKINADIALCGSLFTEEKLLEKFIKTIAKKKFPNIRFIKPKQKPVWGAVEIGKALYKKKIFNV